MKLHVAFTLVLIFASGASSAESWRDRDAGHRDYDAAEFKKAASHFQQALKADPNDVDSCFWLGKSYEMLADLSGPLLGTRTSFKARLYLTEAFQLAPNNDDYRHELFEFLIVSDHSPGALHLAETIIQVTPKSDPDYPFMQLQWQKECRVRSSAEYRVERAFGFLPQKLARISQTSAPTVREGKSIALLPQALK
jgi:tetratricopeptide (TPR) repeat protein